MFFYGKGANGKGTLIEIISAVLGRDNVVERSCESLCEENSRTVADLEGKLLNVCAEMGKKVNITNFKLLASGDPMTSRRLYQEPRTITDYAKLLFSCNELPRSIEHTYAYFRRLIPVPFEHIVKDGEMNHTLGQEIIAEELPGVLNWILEGYERLTKQGYFTESPESKKVLDNYIVASDAVASFLDDMNYCPVPVGSGEEITLAEFYKRYDHYCGTNHFHVHNSRTFSSRIRGFGYQYKRKSDCYYVYVGKQSRLEEEKDKIKSLWDNDTMSTGAETAGVTIVDVQPDKAQNDSDKNANVEVQPIS